MITITQTFDGGNIDVIDSSHPQHITLAIKPDHQSSFFQWFYFRVHNVKDEALSLHLSNAEQAAFVGGWEGYQAVASYDGEYWFRVPTHYEKGELIITHTPSCDTVNYAYFTPYPLQRHEHLIQQAQSAGCTHRVIGTSIQGRSIDCLRVGAEDAAYKIWVIARQHPGETMAEWFVEGLLDELLDQHSALAEHILQQCAFYLVPNMNPDGSFLGHLRTNAVGVNLNREWQTPSDEKSPEVLGVREHIKATGCDLFLDIHGDEALPWNFIDGQYADHAKPEIITQEADFKANYVAVNPDFQTTHGYPTSKFTEEALTLASKWVGNHFGIPSMTLEMPFKDNQARPDPIQGWSAERSMRLGASVLYPIRCWLDNK